MINNIYYFFLLHHLLPELLSCETFEKENLPFIYKSSYLKEINTPK